MRIISPRENESIDLHTEAQRNYLAEDRSSSEVDDFYYLDLKMTLDENGMDNSHSGFLSFKWEPAVSAALELSESPDFADSLIYRGDGECLVDNLKIGTKYYARAKADGEVSPVIAFSTLRNYPRMITIDGASNVRDVGGCVTRDGRVVKQGLLYRGSELNSHVNVTEKGLETMREILRIKSEIDLRNSNEQVMDVYHGNYVNIPIPAYKNFLAKPELSREIIDFLANEDNYPIYFHCWGGADRTESFIFLFGLLLGISIDDLIDDYELTSLSVFGARSRNKEIFKNYLIILEDMEGADLYEKGYNYLLSCGIEPEKLEKVRSIFLD